MSGENRKNAEPGQRGWEEAHRKTELTSGISNLAWLEKAEVSFHPKPSGVAIHLRLFIFQCYHSSSLHPHGDHNNFMEK